MTLIAVYKKSGDKTVCVGRCDARCYEASQSTCDCICQGVNHCAGQKQAMDNTRAMFGEWEEQYIREKQLTNVSWDVPILQGSLFDCD